MPQRPKREVDLMGILKQKTKFKQKSANHLKDKSKLLSINYKKCLIK